MTYATPTAATKVPRILVVDDTADNLFLMNGLFEDRYDVVQAASGADALKVIMSANPPDMVLLDIMMPDMDGYEVLRRIRQHTPAANIPVIFLTALASIQDEMLGRELGAIDYLTKPIDANKVIAHVEAHVRATAEALRLEALSEKLARHLSSDVWQALFYGDMRESIRFEQKMYTMVCADASDCAAWSAHGLEAFAYDVARMAEIHGGVVDHFVDHTHMVFFEDPAHAVKMAVDLQRCAVGLRPRIGIHSGICDFSTFGSDLHSDCTLIGPETKLAAKVADAASNGDVILSLAAQVVVGPEVHVNNKGCLIAIDWADSVPFMPQPSAPSTPGWYVTPVYQR